jgi:serine/threonine protein kinase
MAADIARELARCTEKIILEHIAMWTALPLDSNQVTANLLRLNLFLDEFRNNSPRNFAEWILAISVLGDWARENHSDELLASLVFSVVQMGNMVCKGEAYESLSAMNKKEETQMQITREEHEKRVSLINAVPANEKDLLSLTLNKKLWEEVQKATEKAGRGAVYDDDPTPDDSRMDVDGAEAAAANRPVVVDLAGLQTPEERHGLPIGELNRLLIKPSRVQEADMGSGKYGVVYKVKLDGMEVAAKKFKKATEKEFMREVYFSARLRHPGVVGYRGYCHNGSTKMLLMDCMLYSFRDHFSDSAGSLRKVPINVRVRWALQLSATIQYLHSNNVVHRDINTRNILLSPDHVIKLCDFTYALGWETRANMVKRLKGREEIVEPPLYRSVPPVTYAHIRNACISSYTAVTLNEQPRFVGTSRYMAPEVLSHHCTDYEAADVWSLATTVLEILSGIKPLSNIRKEDYVVNQVKKLFSDYLARPDSDFQTASDNALHRDHFLTDERLDVSNIYGMPSTDEKEVDTLLQELTFALAFDPPRRPSSADITSALAAVDGLFRSLRYQRLRIENNQPSLPTLAAWPAHFATFHMPTLATFIAPNAGRSSSSMRNSDY